jgi:hypothetical protein
MQPVIDYLREWLLELQDIDRPTPFEREIMDQLHDRIVGLEGKTAQGLADSTGAQ